MDNVLSPEEHKAFANLFIEENQLLADDPPFDYNYILGVFGGCCIPWLLVTKPEHPITRAVARVLSFQPEETQAQLEKAEGKCRHFVESGEIPMPWSEVWDHIEPNE